MKTQKGVQLPIPLAAELATDVRPHFDEAGNQVIGPSADDEVSGNTTYTDD